jgi:GT2 family glycosyltransferase
MSARDLRVSIVVPFHRNLAQLDACLGALQPLPPWADLTIAADGAVDRCHGLALQHRAQVVEIDGPLGPAVARNRAVAATTGDIVVFIDSDVVVAPGVVEQFRNLFTERRDVAAAFGAYDEEPRDSGFMSQYKNLAHSYFHQISKQEARTFWAGVGAVRRAAFDEVGGFDERFSRPCVEDIELGYRLTSYGHKVLLDPSIRGCHLKRWTFRSSVRSDLRDRGIPWTQLILSFKGLDSDLNLQVRQRIAVVLAYAAAAAAVAAVANPLALIAAALAVASLVAINTDYYAFFARRKGAWFALRVIPVHVVHHWCNGVSFAVGTALYYATRAGASLPGALPQTRWTRARSGTAYERAGRTPALVPDRASRR